MFTGIVSHLGKIISKKNGSLAIEAPISITDKLSPGASIAVNGICLTVIKKENNKFMINYMPETKNKTNIRYLKKFDLVNLELPLQPTSYLAGHIVQGHVDTVSQIIKIEKDQGNYIFTLSLKSDISKYIVNKGSIAINGISLTVIKADKNFFTVGIIPYTWKNTMLHKVKIEDYVNIEVDILAKYLEKLTSK